MWSMRRAWVGLVLLLAVGVSPGLSGCSRACMAYEYSIASGAKGAATSVDALSAWLRDAPQGFNTDPASWSPSPKDPTTYSDGTGLITVEQVSGQATGYFVTSAQTCNE